MFERGVLEAYRQHDMHGLAAMMNVSANQLDGVGRLEETLPDVDHALALAEHSPDETALLESMRASILLGLGEIDSALASARLAKGAMDAATDDFSILSCRTNVAVVGMRTLRYPDLSEIEAIVAATQRDGRDNDSMFLITWLIPYLFAIGRRTGTPPWIRALRLYARDSGHSWRLDDTTVYEYAVYAREDRMSAPEPVLTSDNWLALMRKAILQLHDKALAGNWEGAATHAQSLAETVERAYSAYRDDLDGYAEFIRASRGHTSIQGRDPPQAAHLMNLGCVLAQAEAVGLAGSQAQATTWLRWFAQSLPSEVETSLEWPVSRARVEALVCIRAGDHRRGASMLRQAIEWSESTGYVSEAAMAKVQLAELLLHSDLKAREWNWRGLREVGWAALTTLGIDPTRSAYAVAHSAGLARDDRVSPKLTPREVEVLALLESGMTYKEAAHCLGIRWPTIQTLAHRAYEKLGVSGKIQAAAAAREQGIL